MDQNQPLSFSRLGPMDPRQLHYELGQEVAVPPGPAAPVPAPALAPRRRRRGRLRRLRNRGGGE